MQYFVYGEKSCEIHIDLVISSREDFCNPGEFLAAAIRFLDKKIYPGEDISGDYDGIILKAGMYAEIVTSHIRAMDQKIDINIQNIQQSFRIMFPGYEPLRDEFILVTPAEYIMFAWSTSE